MTTIDITLPASARTAGYNPEAAKDRYAARKLLIEDKYHYDKFIGKRRKTGALNLNSLNPVHKQYVSCFINGMKGVDIADHFGVAAITVYRVLADPLARSLIVEFDERFKDEFRSMFPLVSDAVREGLESSNLTNKMRAVDRWTKVARFLEGVDADDEGAGRKTETVIAARVKLTSLIKDAAESLASAIGEGNVVEGEVIVSEKTS